MPADDAFLAFSLGPVQSFISAARTTRDLWAGSYLLSWLTFQAMKPVLEAHGPEALVFPAMEHNPLWLWSEDRRLERKDALLEPCLPNRFLARVPAAGAANLARQCEDRCQQEWTSIAEAVRQELLRLHPDATLEPGGLWEQQVGSVFEIQTAVLPWEQAMPEVLQTFLGHQQNSSVWGSRWLLIVKLLAAGKSVRHFPNYRPDHFPDDKVPQKCSLLGSYEHLGPGDRDQTRTFWQQAAQQWAHRGTRTGENERLCAVSLVKRFAWPDYFARLFRMDVRELRFEDTATVAAALWLKQDQPLFPNEVRDEDRKTWSGQWLHWSKQHQDPDEDRVPDDVWARIRSKRSRQGGPPTYYAVLMMDADRMGDRLARVSNAEDHRKISTALAEFALTHTRRIVENVHHGDLIYAGGDDVLAFLPTETALQCALDLQRQLTALTAGLPPDGSSATVSAGLVVCHYKEDLRFALATARKAEKDAKNGGRNALQIAVCRRSGEHSSAFCPWSFLDRVIALVDAFRKGASDRWAYRLKAELETLQGLEPAAMGAELRRQVNRSEDTTKHLLGGAANLENALVNYFKAVQHKCKPPEALDQFVTLCQSASFLARGGKDS
jgi:CRISPR-associated protein Cmr2